MIDVCFITFEDFNERDQIGSSRIRARWVAKHWDGAEMYIPGKKYDIEIYQKVYWERRLKVNPAIKILDICDPDWMERPSNQYFRKIIEYYDAITFPTKEFKKFFDKYLPNIPNKVIPDRLDLDLFDKRKVHKGTATKVVWFGYSQNQNVLHQAAATLRALKLKLTVISDDLKIYITKTEDKELFNFVKYNEDTINDELIKNGDICLLPPHRNDEGELPHKALYKSDNKTINAWALGLPVATNAEELEFYLSAENRQNESEEKWHWTRANRDVRQSVVDYLDLIASL